MPPIEVPGVVAALLTLGLVGIALLAIVEKLIPIVPSHVVFLFLGMSAVSDGEDLLLTILAATGGSTIGALCWYALGRTLGAKRSEALVVHFGRYVFLSPSRYKRLTEAYRRNHFQVTLVGQVIPGVRLYLPLPAGVLRLPPSSFLAATLLGTLMWNTPLLALGYALRGTCRDPASVGLLILGGLVTAEVAMFLALHFGARRTFNAPEDSA